jgi:hypothetical protein
MISHPSQARNIGKRMNRKRGVTSSGSPMRKTNLVTRTTTRAAIKPRIRFPAEKEPVMRIQNTNRQQKATSSLYKYLTPSPSIGLAPMLHSVVNSQMYGDMAKSD